MGVQSASQMTTRKILTKPRKKESLTEEDRNEFKSAWMRAKAEGNEELLRAATMSWDEVSTAPGSAISTSSE